MWRTGRFRRADAFLVKPVGHLQLIAVVKDLLGLSAVLRRSDPMAQ